MNGRLPKMDPKTFEDDPYSEAMFYIVNALRITRNSGKMSQEEGNTLAAIEEIIREEDPLTWKFIQNWEGK